MSFLTNLQTAAESLLTTYGEAISIERVTPGAYNPATGEPAAGTTLNYTGVGLPTVYNNEEIDGTNILQDDTLLIFYSTTKPLVNDRVTINSIVYSARNVQEIRTQGGNVLYKIQCRI